MNITISSSQSFPGDITNGLRKLKEADVRIILGNFNETWARNIFCEAYKQVTHKLQGKRVTFIEPREKTLYIRHLCSFNTRRWLITETESYETHTRNYKGPLTPSPYHPKTSDARIWIVDISCYWPMASRSGALSINSKDVVNVIRTCSSWNENPVSTNWAPSLS